MKHIRVVFYDEDKKSIIEHENFPEGEIELNTMTHSTVINTYLKVDEIIINSKTYTILTRTFSVDGAKLILSLKLNP